MTKDKQLKRYLLWAFGLAWPLQAAASWFAWQGQLQIFRLLLMATMFAPLAAALLARIPLRDMGWKPTLRGKWRWFFAAWLGPAVLSALGAALYFALFPARLDLSGGAYAAQLGEEALAQLEARGLTLERMILIQIVGSLSYAPFLNILPSLGEEVGWRGAMYPILKERLGAAKGRVLGGVIWGAWHWPVMLLAGYEYGLQYWGAPVLGPLLFCVFTVGVGTLIDLLYEKTGCIWIPSLAHGAVNSFAGVPVLFLNPAYADQLTVGPLIIGVVGGLPMLLLALAVLLRRRSAPSAAREIF